MMREYSYDEIDEFFEEWKKQIRPVVSLGDEGITNEERYGDILDYMSIAFHNGFQIAMKQRRKYAAEEWLQK